MRWDDFYSSYSRCQCPFFFFLLCRYMYFSDGSKYNRKLNRYLYLVSREKIILVRYRMSHFFHIRMRHFLHIVWIFILVNHKLLVQFVVVSTYILRIVKKIHSKIIFWTFEPSLLTFFPLDQSEKWQTIKYCLAILLPTGYLTSHWTFSTL